MVTYKIIIFPAFNRKNAFRFPRLFQILVLSSDMRKSKVVGAKSLALNGYSVLFISKDRFSFLTSNLSQAKGAERF